MAGVCDHGKLLLKICRLIEDRPRLRYASSRLRLIAAVVAWMKRSVIRVGGCVTVRPPELFRHNFREQIYCASVAPRPRRVIRLW